MRLRVRDRGIRRGGGGGGENKDVGVECGLEGWGL